MKYVLIAILVVVVVTITCMRNSFLKKNEIEMHKGDTPEKKEVEPSEPQPKTSPEKPESQKRRAKTKQAEK